MDDMFLFILFITVLASVLAFAGFIADRTAAAAHPQHQQQRISP